MIRQITRTFDRGRHNLISRLRAKSHPGPGVKMSTLAVFHEFDLTEGESETGGDQYQES